MKTIVNVLLGLLIIFLAYVLMNNIKDPIEFKNEKDARHAAVVAKLKQVRTAQEAYFGIKDKYADSFDSLKLTLSTGKFTLVNVFGDADAVDLEEQVLTYDTTYVSAADSMAVLNIDLDSLRYVPYAGGEFDIYADTLTYQRVLVNVVEVKVRRSKYMGKYAGEKYRKYDSTFDPETDIKFGDMSKPSLAGNWE